MAKSEYSPLTRIKMYCLECAGSAHEVKLCPCDDCPLWCMRFGKNTLIPKREMTEEQRAAAVERLCKARESKK